MKTIEDDLMGYYYAKKDIPRSLNNLEAAQRRLAGAYIPANMAVNPSLARVQKSEVESQVERTVQMICDELQTDVKYIADQLTVKRAVMAWVDGIIEAAQLNGREREYVRLRYQEGREPSTCMTQMQLSGDDIGRRTYYRIRSSALDKLEIPYRACGGAGSMITSE